VDESQSPEATNQSASSSDAVTRNSRRRLIITAAAAAILMAIYWSLPVDTGEVSFESQLLFFVGVTILTAIVGIIAFREVRHASRATRKARMIILVLVILTSIVFFSQTYFRIAQSPGQFDELSTRLDAMYFTVTTAMTVGYGDVHAVSQLARFYVLINMAFNALVIGTAIKMFGFIARGQNHPRSGSGAASPQVPAPAAGSPSAAPIAPAPESPAS
jgi:voltage-gated potassium channel